MGIRPARGIHLWHHEEAGGRGKYRARRTGTREEGADQTLQASNPPTAKADNQETIKTSQEKRVGRKDFSAKNDQISIIGATWVSSALSHRSDHSMSCDLHRRDSQSRAAGVLCRRILILLCHGMGTCHALICGD